jgi:hypothetical protein
MSIRGLKSPMRRPFASVRLHPSTMRSLCIILCIPVVFQPSLRAGEEGAVWGLQLSLPRVPAALYGPFCTTLQPPKRRRGRTAARSAAFPRNPPRGGGGAQPRAARRSLATPQEEEGGAQPRAAAARRSLATPQEEEGAHSRAQQQRGVPSEHPLQRLCDSRNILCNSHPLIRGL